jgi:DNA-binding XRE family transcriptional regulator
MSLAMMLSRFGKGTYSPQRGWDGPLQDAPAVVASLVTPAQETTVVKPAQVRMARAALEWSLAQLAEASGVHRNTISNFETGRYAGKPESLDAIRAALEAAGIIFIEENGGGPGVRLRKAGA